MHGKRLRKRLNRKEAEREAKKAKSEATGDGATPQEDGDAVPEVDEQEEDEKKLVPKIKMKKLDLAIRKMLFLSSPSGNQDDGLLVLSSVGSNALLAYPTASLLPSRSGPAQHQLLKLDHPILDITASITSSHLFVSLDTSIASSSSSSSSSRTSAAIQSFALSSSGQLEPASHPAVQTLLEQCSAQVTENDPYPNTLALYPDISLLSKDPSDMGATAAEGGDDTGDAQEGEDSVIAEED